MAGDKYIYNNAGTHTEKAAVQASAGAGDAGKIPALDAGGKLDATMMPSGVAADVKIITTSEALADGDFVNIWTSSGTKARKADATSSGKLAHGYVKAAYGSAGSATVYLSGINDHCTGLTVGDQFLSTTAGAPSATAPSAAGNVVQRLGVAISTTELQFDPQEPLVLA